MSIISEIIRFISWFIEIYLLMKLFETVLYNKKRNDVKNLDILIAFCGSCLLQICSHTTIIMYFTRLIFIWYVYLPKMWYDYLPDKRKIKEWRDMI